MRRMLRGIGAAVCALAVGVGAANLVEPYACKTIIENLPAVMERYGMENLTEIIGGAHHG